MTWPPPPSEAPPTAGSPDPTMASGGETPYPGSVGAVAAPYPGALRRPNTLATAAFVVALIGFGTGVAAPVGAILGHAARRQIRRTGEDGDGYAVAAIIVGWTITGLALIAACLAGVLVVAT